MRQSSDGHAQSGIPAAVVTGVHSASGECSQDLQPSTISISLSLPLKPSTVTGSTFRPMPVVTGIAQVKCPKIPACPPAAVLLPFHPAVLNCMDSSVVISPFSLSILCLCFFQFFELLCTNEECITPM